MYGVYMCMQRTAILLYFNDFILFSSDVELYGICEGILL